MNFLFDLHTHTKYSHGKGTVFENAAVAQTRRISLGIADHGAGHVYFGVNNRKMLKMMEDIRSIRSKNPPFSILQGVEANLMGADGKCDLDSIPIPEFVLMGFHKGIFPKSLLSVSLFGNSFFSKDRTKNILTQAMIAALERYPIDAITHPGEYLPVDMKELASAASKLGVLLELNNKHPMTAYDAQIALDSGAVFLASSDAHRSIDVGNFEKIISFVAAQRIPEERIVNSRAYRPKHDLRIDRLLNTLSDQK